MAAPTHVSPPPSIPLALFEKREELRRVLESKQFAGAPMRSRFLEFVTEQTLQGNGDKLNEYLIGIEVYDRGAGFDPQQDPIVRVQATDPPLAQKVLRGKRQPECAAYRPASGHYVPVFSRSAVSARAPLRPPRLLQASRERDLGSFGFSPSPLLLPAAYWESSWQWRYGKTPGKPRLKHRSALCPITWNGFGGRFCLQLPPL